MSHSEQPLYKQFFHSFRRFLAKHWLSFQPAIQIAITGSQGKTNTTNTIFHILSSLGNTVATDTNLDTIYNVPITALRVMPWTQFAVFELGVDKPNEMDFHLMIVKPKIAIITGISPVHTDKEHLGSFENLIKEKRKLIEALPKDGYAVLNWDDQNVREMAYYTKARIFWYGTNKEHCDVWAENTSVSLDGIQSTFHHGEQSFTISSSLIGKHQIYNLMAAYFVYTIVSKHNFSLEQYLKAVKSTVPLKGRMSVEKGPMQTIVLNDSLRANPSSTTSGLQTLSEIIHTKGRKIAVLAEMGELQNPQEEHTKIGAFISSLSIDYLVLIGPLQKYTAESAVENSMKNNRVFWVADVHKAAKILQTIIHPYDILYLKGSLLRHVERVLLILDGTKVECRAITCPFYHSCLMCQYRKTGYRE